MFLAIVDWIWVFERFSRGNKAVTNDGWDTGSEGNPL